MRARYFYRGLSLDPTRAEEILSKGMPSSAFEFLSPRDFREFVAEVGKIKGVCVDFEGKGLRQIYDKLNTCRFVPERKEPLMLTNHFSRYPGRAIDHALKHKNSSSKPYLFVIQVNSDRVNDEFSEPLSHHVLQIGEEDYQWLEPVVPPEYITRVVELTPRISACRKVKRAKALSKILDRL